MRSSFIFVLISLVLITACNDASNVSVHTQKKDIEQLCTQLQKGMDIDEANSIMKGVEKIRSEKTSGYEAGAGDLYYWNGPTDLELITQEPLRMVIPHNATCLVRFDTQKKIYEVIYEFIDEEAFQKQRTKTQRKL